MNIQQDNSKQNARTRHIDIRLTQKEYEAIVEKAAECGLTLSNYGRRLLQNHHPNKRLSDKEVQGLNSLSDARADLIRIQNVLKSKPDEIKKRYFRDEDYMRAWIEAVNRLIVRWGQIRDSINKFEIMIAQGNAISHGARAIEYSIDKDKARLVKVNDLPENIEPLAMWSRMMQHQHQCMKDRYNPKPITLNALRFEISPAKEESAGWTMTDWQNLADEFIAVLDSIDRRCGKPDSHLKPTNIKNSQYVVSLHTDSKSGIPHLHIVANRIDNMGKTNDAHYIGERAVHAANIINERRGWVQSVQRRDENIQQISEDCIAILKAMPEFDWETYCQMLNAKGYDIKLTKDDEGVVKGYAIRKGNSIYKSSILGKSRKLMPSKIEATWAGLHASKEQIPIQPTETEAQTKAHNNKEVVILSNPITHHYSMSVDGEQFEVDIPDMVKSVFDEEFGSLDEEVKQTNLFKVAALLFAGYLDAATSMAASSGGGGSPGDGWGKDKDDDERNWAIRCAKMAKWLCKPIKRSRGR